MQKACFFFFFPPENDVSCIKDSFTEPQKLNFRCATSYGWKHYAWKFSAFGIYEGKKNTLTECKHKTIEIVKAQLKKFKNCILWISE